MKLEKSALVLMILTTHAAYSDKVELWKPCPDSPAELPDGRRQASSRHRGVRYFMRSSNPV